MTSDIETRKAAAVAHAATLAESAVAGAFVAALYRHAPPGDIAARAAEDLAAGALALWRFGARRRPGEALVRVYNPESGDHGWSSPHTIVEIVTDDMPFLVDSTVGAINERGAVVRLVIHPILEVGRDDDGALAALAPAAGGHRESWMQIEIGREPDPAARAALAETIAAILGDVRAAVSDWPAMRAVIGGLCTGLADRPPPLGADETAEVVAFLRWLDEGNFVLLGCRDDAFAGGGPAHPSLGILRREGYSLFGGLRNLAALPRDVQDYVRRSELLIVTKTNQRSTVHRRAAMDAVGVRRFGPAGEVVGVTLLVGLFTSAAYAGSARAIPLLRRKVDRVIARSLLLPDSHDGKALLHILDNFPRDELFQIDEDELFATATGILNLQERQRIALFVRGDPLERFVSCLVYVPRERYDTALRDAFAALLSEAYGGPVTAAYAHLDDSALARLHIVVATTRGAVPAVDVTALEARLVEAGRSWTDRLEEAAAAAFGEGEARARLRDSAPFPLDYQVNTPTAQAVADLARIAAVLAGSPLEASLHPRDDEAVPGLRLYRRGEPVALSDILPIFEHLGLRVVAEEPYRLAGTVGPPVWVHEFTLGDGAVPASLSAAARQVFEAALVAVWTGAIESDGFNRLVLAAGLSARETVILRLYAKVLRQAGSNFSQSYMEDTLAHHAAIARRLVRLFEHRFDPAPAGTPSLDAIAEVQAIDHALDAVESLDEDRILRNFLNLILRSVRTNYFQPLPDGTAKPYLAVKLASSQLELMPLPRPLYEIFVYSPRVEGLHMRAGKVARGGIRWSDRREDFRTEILGLMKAQTVKNAVIIPVGSKGGFVVKHPPADRAALGAEALECYRVLMRGLLDLTDNIVADNPESHRVVPPPAVVRHDDDDPYLVVAADKGTATFSDTANEIAIAYGFWLGDAFASGGSAGYDHKAIGITSRGAWELIKRHFRELGTDIQTTDFTVVGVGDMAGDVFGNGMLQSPHIRLKAAFNHLHIFVDPEPDAAAGFAERRRLFHLERSSWADYDRGRVSPGGGVFERSAKSIALTPEIKTAFAIAEDVLTPAELIRKLLAAEVDLLFFGGIGTFVKAQAESHAEVGDKTNDALRIDGEAIQARVVGEGANLGVTQKGRIAYAQKGGLIDTDAIDNSAGVSMSDHEVNIKILLGHAIATGALAAAERERLLAEMTDDVAGLVLRDNYLQGAALSVEAARGAAALDRQARLIRELERAGRLDRTLEFLPDDPALVAREAARQRLTRPELAVLLAYAKMALDDELLVSDLPDRPEFAEALRGYFPPALRQRFAAQIAAHPLKREIVATLVANDLVNRAGLTFVADLEARTGRGAAEIARAYWIAREVFALPALWADIEALDSRVAAALQSEMLLDIAGVVEHAAAWLLRAGRLDLGADPARLGPAVAHLGEAIAGLLPAEERAVLDTRTARLAAAGVPPPLASRIGGIVFLTTALEVGDLAERTGQSIDRAARLFYGVGDRFALDALRAAARRLPVETIWQKSAAEALVDDFYRLQADLTERVLNGGDGAAAAGGDGDPLAAWVAARATALAPAAAIAAELRAAPTPDLAMLVVAGRQLRQALG